MTIQVVSALALIVGLTATSALAAGTDDMLTACRAQASRQLGVPASIINLRFEGRLADGSYSFEGDTETNPPMMFECSIQHGGRRAAPLATHAAAAGCPVDVSQADRYRYPGCD